VDSGPKWRKSRPKADGRDAVLEKGHRCSYPPASGFGGVLEAPLAGSRAEPRQG